MSPLLDAGYLDATIRRHFEPLLDPAFDDVLRRHCPNGIAFEVDGQELTRVVAPNAGRAPVAIRLGRRRTPSVTGFIERNPLVPSDHEGIAISPRDRIDRRTRSGRVPDAPHRL